MATIHEVLREDQRLHTSFLALLEALPDDTEHVRCTPYVPDLGCSCGRGLILKRSDIEEVELNGAIAMCCGAEHRVYRVFLRAGAQVPAADFMRHLVSSHRAAGPRSSLRLRATRSSTCDCESLYEALAELQEDLQHATPGEKVALIRRINALWNRIEACSC